MELFYGTLSADGLMTLDSEEASHCTRVMRHRPGDTVNIIDGSGTMYVCELTEATPKGASANVLEAVPGFGSHPYRLTMAVCPTKNIDRFEWFAEKATEIGVDVIAPVIGDRSERRVLKTERLGRIVLSAAKQSLKGAVPAVPEPVSVSELLRNAPADALRLICHCAEGKRIELKDALKDAGGKEIFILIGPEGDFSAQEITLAEELGWIPVSLGNSRLRTETAAVVAAAIVYSAQ